VTSPETGTGEPIQVQAIQAGEEKSSITAKGRNTRALQDEAWNKARWKAVKRE
jgi:hypothetical protein